MHMPEILVLSVIYKSGSDGLHLVTACFAYTESLTLFYLPFAPKVTWDVIKVAS